MAPGGDMDSIKAAIAAGADAVYCGIQKFNARNRAANITFDELNGLLRLAHSQNCQIFLTLNIIIVESEIPDLIRLLNKLVNTSIDGVIIQDLGLFYLLSKYFKRLNIHASTQLTTHNEGQISFLHQLNATRVNLSRELSLEEIRSLCRHAHQNKMLAEVFVHGSYCISFSGLCYMSSLQGGNSGNRGRCSQSCRDQYDTTPEGSQLPLNLKDNSAFFDLMDLADAGVDSLKIEGRIKKFHYVYMVVESYNNQLRRFYDGKSLSLDNQNLFKVFNRDFSNGYLKGAIGKEMFIDNPRDNSATHLAGQNGSATEETIWEAERALYQEKGGIRARIKSLIDQMSAGKIPLSISVSGKEGLPLKVELASPESAFVILSKNMLAKRDAPALDGKELLKRFKAINDTEYFIEQLELKDLQPGLQIPFSDLNTMKNRILLILRDGKEHIRPVKIPPLKKAGIPPATPTLSVLISSEKDLDLCLETGAEICFQLPEALSGDMNKLITLFNEHRKITPWFPSVLMRDEFHAAVRFLREIKAEGIVTDNTGIAFEAYQLGIPWIAGPRLNIVNSYALLGLKEHFNCSGAYLSNELKRQQIMGIRKPENFKLYFSIYHPIDLMTSRQCLFQKVSGCSKAYIDEECISTCSKSASISSPDKGDFYIEKTAGMHNRIYNGEHYLNTDVVSDLPDLFTGFLIDLRDIKTKTLVKTGHRETVELFKNLLKGNPGAAKEIRQVILSTSQAQYQNGI